MPRRTFLGYTAIGAVLWATGVTLLGYFLGSVAFIANHLEIILLLIVAVSVLPAAIEVLRARRSSGAQGRDPRYDEPAERQAVLDDDVRGS
jgi:membrane-associated protein